MLRTGDKTHDTVIGGNIAQGRNNKFILCMGMKMIKHLNTDSTTSSVCGEKVKIDKLV